MGLPNRDEIEGKFEQAKGGIKENVGRAINDTDLEQEGRATARAVMFRRFGARQNVKSVKPSKTLVRRSRDR